MRLIRRHTNCCVRLILYIYQYILNSSIGCNMFVLRIWRWTQFCLTRGIWFLFCFLGVCFVSRRVAGKLRCACDRLFSVKVSQHDLLWLGQVGLHSCVCVCLLFHVIILWLSTRICSDFMVTDCSRECADQYYTCTHTHMHACMHKHMHACTHARAHTHTHMHVCMCMHTHTHARMRTRTHKHKHTQTHTQGFTNTLYTIYKPQLQLNR